jgi:hypothetical protein
LSQHSKLWGMLRATRRAHFTFPTPDRSAPELARVLNRIIGSYPFARTIHLVMDNLNIHCRKTLTDYFGEEEGASL